MRNPYIKKRQPAGKLKYLCLFLILLVLLSIGYSFLSGVEQSMYGKIESPLISAEMAVDNESEKITLLAVGGFFLVVIVLLITLALLFVYKMNSIKRKK